MVYPLIFQAVYKDYLWGGRRLADWGKSLPPSGTVAESWELSCHPNGPSVIANGPLAGQLFDEVWKQDPEAWLGRDMSERDRAKFPLLIKLIDANAALSVQVHPTDAYALKNEQGEYGKNEMWYVVYAPEGATLIAGVKSGLTREQFARAIADGTCEDCLQHVPVQAGDCINIPAGLVHAITAGLIIYEVQQNSDTTYRVYDYNRRDAAGNLRPLHVAKALDVIDYANAGGHVRFPGLNLTATGPLRRRMLVINRYFTVEEDRLDGACRLEANGSQFRILTCLGGQLSLTYEKASGTDTLLLNKGQTVFIPATLGAYELQGQDALFVSSYTTRVSQIWTQLKQAAPPERWDELMGLRPYAASLLQR
ncbi:MAG: class I mannose-6-phosphate isomerase [Oscillospiraceae bacterium]|nr:class I mannose-6-phosphate isomerase [Oscillospiraceae bacterium]MDD4367355.1 class I mannose-6-phosphate isomerase [Oscillospiraceae bacterium]